MTGWNLDAFSVDMRARKLAGTTVALRRAHLVAEPEPGR